MFGWNEAAAEKAATDAEDELTNIETFEDMVKWWFKYYLATGHKRLGRIMLTSAKEMGILKDVEQKRQSDY
ncbi:unnamed protein product [marine sediment metagenome]|uniref:Uncharacterized protein n=1 Tax=marine sediment metagenome TaxID=412755 RepID=X1RTV8_9ZZZZ